MKECFLGVNFGVYLDPKVDAILYISFNGKSFALGIECEGEQEESEDNKISDKVCS